MLRFPEERVLLVIMALRVHRVLQVLLEPTESTETLVLQVLLERRELQALRVLPAHQARPQVLLEPIVM